MFKGLRGVGSSRSEVADGHRRAPDAIDRAYRPRGRGAAGKPVIEIYLEADSPSARARIPAQLETVPVRVIVTGPFVAY